MQRRKFLQAIAPVAGTAAGDIPDAEITAQQNKLLDLADRDDDERWRYETTQNLAHVRSELVNTELDGPRDNPNGIIESCVVGRQDILLGFKMSTDNNGSVGTVVHLSAEQAEAQAVDLLEQAHAAREDDDADQ